MAGHGSGSDERVRRTRGAIVSSFNGMFLSRPYDAIRVADIIEKAGIGRSTFYEHFRGKGEVFRHAAAWLLAALADAAAGEGDASLLRRMAEHFLENRRAVSERLKGESGRQFGLWLADVIEARLAVREGATLIPARAAAAQIAAAQIALLRAWLDGRDPCAPEVIATALARTSSALADAVRGS